MGRGHWAEFTKVGRGHHFSFFYEWSELEKVTGESNGNRLGREETKWAEVTGPRSPKWADVTGPRSPWAEVTCIPAWDCQVLYTLVGLRESRKSEGSSDCPRVERKRTSMDVGAVSIRRDPRKSTMCEYLAQKTNLLGMKIAWCASMAAQLYISQETELEFEW